MTLTNCVVFKTYLKLNIGDESRWVCRLRVTATDGDEDSHRYDFNVYLFVGILRRRIGFGLRLWSSVKQYADSSVGQDSL